MSRASLVSIAVVALALGASACGSSSNQQQLGPAAGLAFSVAPKDGVSGQSLADISVQVVDAKGHPVTNSLPIIQLDVGTAPTGATLTGANRVQSTVGISTFSGLTLDKAGAYTLVASAPGLTSAVSPTFNVQPGAPASLVFVGQPSNVVVGGVFPQPVTVELHDAAGNVATSVSAPVTMAIGNNPSSAHLLGTATQAAVNGIATFSDLAVDTPGVNYTLSASGAGLGSATSAAFDAHAPTNFVYTDPPTGTKLRLVKNAASTNTTIVLDLVTTVPLTAYAVAMDLPMDRNRVQANPTLLIPGTALNPGTNPVAAGAGLPTSGTYSGVLAVGLTQKAAGNGAVTTDTAIPAGSTLFTVQLDVGGSGLGGTVFDGSALGSAFRAALLDKTGNSVATSADFGIGVLSLQ